MNPCSPNPCNNNGQCNPAGNSYSCTCPPLLTGQNCNQVSTVAPLSIWK